DRVVAVVAVDDDAADRPCAAADGELSLVRTVDENADVSGGRSLADQDVVVAARAADEQGELIRVRWVRTDEDRVDGHVPAVAGRRARPRRSDGGSVD